MLKHFAPMFLLSSLAAFPAMAQSAAKLGPGDLIIGTDYGEALPERTWRQPTLSPVLFDCDVVERGQSRLKLFANCTITLSSESGETIATRQRPQPFGLGMLRPKATVPLTRVTFTLYCQETDRGRGCQMRR